MGIDDRFYEYFRALDRSGGEDRCYLCRRTPAEVKLFFGFDEDGTPFEAEELGLEDVALEHQDVMSYLGIRPVCAVCQLNMDAIVALGEEKLLSNVLDELTRKRDQLWPKEGL
ncbi:MAG: hypothetical protein ACI9F9_001084 [Candidatus Paceibacteria bacterium]|jgi:hypothetical protein